MKTDSPPDIKQKRDEIERLMEAHEGALLRHATGLTGDSAAAQHVVQTVFMRLAKAWGNGSRPSPKIKYWLYREAHREATAHVFRLGKANGSRRREPTNGQRPHAAILRHLHALPPREREVILLRLQEGLSCSEIAMVCS